MFNKKAPLGQVNKAKLPNGTEVERADFVIMKLGENINFFPVIYSDIHFLYQHSLPISDFDLATKYKGKIPKNLIGPNVMCSCGAEGVLMLEGPYANQVMCKSLATTGFHQTSHKIVNGKLILNDEAQKNLAGDSDLTKGMKSQEQALDEASDARKNE